MIMYILSTLSALTTQCGVAFTYGTDPHYWTYSSVVYAEVVGAEEYSKNRYRLVLKPIATLTGPLDAALHDHLTFDIFGPNVIQEGSLFQIPRKGTMVVAVVEDHTDWDKPFYAIPGGPVQFMPKGLGLIEVTGFDDPKVTETIENLRKLRGKQREDAEKQSAAEKKSSAEPKSKP